MRTCERVGIGLIAAVLGVAALAGTASAQKKMAVLIDATASMSTERTSGDACRQANGRECTRLDAAKLLAEEAILGLGGNNPGVAVYSFDGAGLRRHTKDEFRTPQQAVAAVRAITISTGESQLASSFCDVTTALYDRLGVRSLYLVVDGVDTGSAKPCGGINDLDPPYDAASWQSRVHERASVPPAGVSRMTLNIALLTAPTGADSRLATFYGSLASAAGGALHVFKDSDAVARTCAFENGIRSASASWNEFLGRMVVVLDASDAMKGKRRDGTTCFEAAKTAAILQIQRQREMQDVSVAVVTLENRQAIWRTNGFVDALSARQTILGLARVGGAAPVAAALCDAADVLWNEATSFRSVVLLWGGVDASPEWHPCFGPSSSDPDPPYSWDSWQARVMSRLDAGWDGGIVLIGSLTLGGR
jgi:hypothetical protein